MMPRRDEESAGWAAECAARHGYGKLVAFLAARTGNVTAAEDALADAFTAALADWPISGVPRNPEAWLMAVAKRRAIDAARRRRTSGEAADHLRLMTEELNEDVDGDLPDRRLGLMFACAHPAIDPAMRAPLMLQTILGFDAAAIASAFLVSPATMGQRLVRAKQKIRQAGIPLRVPEQEELPERLDAVLAAMYASFAVEWSEPGDLADEAVWLGRLVVALLPEEAEALGLLALMLYVAARRDARRDPAGDYVPLAEQDTGLWDAEMLDEAEAVLQRASGLGFIGRYQLEAAVQSAHVARRITGRTDWAVIEQLYATLASVVASPVIVINHAMAIGETHGPEAGLARLDALADDVRVAEYQPYWAARADLLARAGHADAASAYQRAIGLASDNAVRRFLQARLSDLAVYR